MELTDGEVIVLRRLARDPALWLGAEQIGVAAWSRGVGRHLLELSRRGIVTRQPTAAKYQITSWGLAELAHRPGGEDDEVLVAAATIGRRHGSARRRPSWRNWPTASGPGHEWARPRADR